MLLLIALAHAPTFVDGGGGPRWLDTAGDFTRALVAENQARWMFIFLFGYGVGQFVTGRAARGTDWSSVRGVLRRRGVVFLLVGLLHSALLVPIDIIAVYGATLLLCAGLARASDRALLWVAGAAALPAVALLGWQTGMALIAQASGTPQSMVRYMSADYLTHVVSQLPTWLPETVLSVVVVVPGMALGIWASRRRFLDEPEQHTCTLRVATAVLLTVALITRLPEAFVFAGWPIEEPVALWTLAVIHTMGGFAGGLGLAGAVALVIARRGVRPGRVTAALAALGRRSLTFYLAQSAIWLVLFYPFTLDLADRVSTSGALGIAFVVWATSVVAAAAMERHGLRGPLEQLTRRLTATPWRHSRHFPKVGQ